MIKQRITILALAAATLFATLAAPVTRVPAQDDLARYVPAMLPAFAGDLAAHAGAPRYTLAMRIVLDDDNATITGQQHVIYTNRTPGIALSEIVFRLYPNLDSYAGVMDVQRVAVDDALIKPQYDATRSVMTLLLPEPLPAGGAVTLALDYTITIPRDETRLYGQFGWRSGVLSLPEAYPLLAVYEPGRGWWAETAHPQGDIVFSETAFYDVRITAPAGLIVITGGVTVGLDSNPDGTLTHTIVAPLVREFAVMASADYVALEGEQDGTRITLYYNPDLPDAANQSRAGLQVVQDSVRVFNAAFGAYPFAELDVVQTPNTAGGMEYPGLFVIDGGVWSSTTGLFDFLLVHETAHQWWYSLVGNDQARDPWIDEALAQYAVAVYIRALEGEDAYRAALESFRRQYAAFIAEHPDQMIGEPVSAYPDEAYFMMVYQKGPLFYAALDAQFGTEALLAALREMFAAYRYGILYPDDLRAALEASLGADLGAVFAEWVAPAPVG